MAWLAARNSPVAHKVLITLGGADPDNVTLKVIQALQQVETENLEAIVIIGGSNPHIEILQSAIRNQNQNQKSQDSPGADSQHAGTDGLADVAITAGGSTCWESPLWLPSLAIVLADNQRPSAEHLDRLGVLENLGWFDAIDCATLRRR